MCGIFGIYDRSGADEGLLVRMSDAIHHRGPDDRGFFVDGPFGFGMNRLSIIDLSTGHQPIFNEQEDAVIVFNGEIYNFREIALRLKSRGHSFKTSSDTETILHLFEEKGTDAFSELRGMFGIAIWNMRKKELTLCRDRFGKKPIYYYNKNGRFAFASEIKALLTLSFIDKRVAPKGLDAYLTHHYIPGPLTIFDGIYKLQPGCFLKFDGSKIEVGRYWDLPAFTSELTDERECIAKTRELLTDAVKARLISEVPLGAFLSGGLDSSAIVALMAQVSGGPVKTFSVGFEESDFNELDYAREVARLFKTDHHEIVVKADAAELLPGIVWHLDEPIADPAVIPTYLISEYARKYVKVVLTGEGGDEVFAGYSTFRYQKWAHDYQTFFPAVVQQAIENLSLRVLKDRKLKQGIWSLSQPLETQGAAWRTAMSSEERHQLYTEEFAERVLNYDSTAPFKEAYRAGTGTFMDRMLQADTKMWLPDDLLMKVDKMSMAHSLEARTPFLDHRLVEFSAKVPFKLKLKGGEGKYILKKAMEGILPASIIYRKKHGFDLPIDRWLRSDLKGMVDNLLSEEKVRRGGIFRPETVTEIVERQRTGERWYQRKVWCLLIFQLWHERFIGE